ncbi:MAG: aminopeptidase [Streptosporangiales bacterium]|nr:aminopeptidase [Streptosporangiales bacterium]
MRVLVSVDMEGIAGVVAGDDVQPGHHEYERNRAYMTAEANAAVRGVLAHDPDATVLVADAHSGFRNLLPHELDRRCTLIRGKPRAHGMVAGLDHDVDAVVFIGYHGRAGLGTSVLSHTISGAAISAVRCNGRELGETGLNAALAAHYDVAPVLAAGDDTLAGEAEEAVPGMFGVPVKWALGAYAAQNLHPEEACARIEAAVPDALAERANVRPLHVEAPVDLEVDLVRPGMTERALLVPGVKRRGGRTLGYVADDIAAAHDLVTLFAVLATTD